MAANLQYDGWSVAKIESISSYSAMDVKYSFDITKFATHPQHPLWADTGLRNTKVSGHNVIFTFAGTPGYQEFDFYRFNVDPNQKGLKVRARGAEERMLRAGSRVRAGVDGSRRFPTQRLQRDRRVAEPEQPPTASLDECAD